MKNLKLFDNHNAYDTYSNSIDYVLPNVSYCIEDKCLHYKKFVKNDYLKLKYNVTSTSEATPLIAEGILENVTEIIIDGNSISPVKEYTFATTGEHEIWFKFTHEAITNPNSTTYGVTGWQNNLNVLEVIEIPTELVCFYGAAFNNCINIIKVNLNTPNCKFNFNGYTGSTFENCTSLEEIIIPNSVTEIKNRCISNCISLKELNLPKSLILIGTGACNNLESITELVIPNSVETIESGAFAGCFNLETLVLSSSMKEIQPGNWNDTGNGTKLKDVSIPEGIETIWGGAFFGCSELETIIIPASVTNIVGGAFSNTGLTEIICKSTTAPIISDTGGSFSGVPSNGTLYVPYGCTEAYSAWMEDPYLGGNGWTIQELPQE